METSFKNVVHELLSYCTTCAMCNHGGLQKGAAPPPPCVEPSDTQASLMQLHADFIHLIALFGQHRQRVAVSPPPPPQVPSGVGLLYAFLLVMLLLHWEHRDHPRCYSIRNYVLAGPTGKRTPVHLTTHTAPTPQIYNCSSSSTIPWCAYSQALPAVHGISAIH
jgi:hypothetical protein